MNDKAEICTHLDPKVTLFILMLLESGLTDKNPESQTPSSPSNVMMFLPETICDGTEDRWDGRSRTSF